MGTELAKIEIDKPEIPKSWDYEKANRDFDRHIRNWRRLTGDVVSQLWVFYNKLKVGHRPKSSLNREQLPTWEEWLTNKGIGKNTPTLHFQQLGWLPSDSLVDRLTGNIENYTPEVVIDKVRAVLDEIDLDPASCKIAQKIVKAKTYYTEKDDGLTKSWEGRVFLNPPYSMPQIRNFTDKLIEELPNIDAAILLTNDQTDTAWWHKCAINAKAICIPSGRIRFYTPGKEQTSPTNGQTFFYYGDNVAEFRNIFSEVGLIVKVLS